MKQLKYISTEFILHDYHSRKHMLHIYVIENESNVYIEFASVCLYFEDRLKKEMRKLWKEKSVIIGFNDSIPLCFFSFNAFYRLILPEK